MGGRATVSIDGSPPSDASIPRTIAVTEVKEVRLVHGGAPAIRPVT
jgi:hypothetical protein